MQKHKETQEKALFFQIGSEKLIELSLTSFGLYGLVWTYQNWLQISHLERGITPWLRTVLSVFYQYDLYRRVHQQRQQDEQPPRWKPARVYFLFLVFTLIPVWLLANGHPWGVLVIMLTLLPNLLVNQTINLIHDTRMHFFAQNTELTGLDWGVIISGLVAWLTVLILAISQ